MESSWLSCGSLFGQDWSLGSTFMDPINWDLYVIVSVNKTTTTKKKKKTPTHNLSISHHSYLKHCNQRTQAVESLAMCPRASVHQIAGEGLISKLSDLEMLLNK